MKPTRSQLLAFLMATLAAGPGLATSSEVPAAQGAERVLDDEPSAPRPSELPVDPDPWQTRIEARLAEIAENGGVTPRAPVSPPTRRRPELERLLRMPEGVQIGVHVRDLDTGSVLFDRNGDQRLHPASNIKLVTALAAVDLLGPEYRFETRLLRDGDALVLLGEGDPSLLPEDLGALAREAVRLGAAHGVREILVDDRVFSPRRFGPGYDPDGPGFSYMAPSGALSLQFNTIEIEVAAGTDRQVAVSVEPPCSHVIIESSVRTAAGGRPTIETHERGPNTIVRVGGTFDPRRGPVKIRRRVHDPGLFAGTVFAQALAAASGQPELPVHRGHGGDRAVTIARHRSAPLPDVLVSALKYSNNFATEQVLRTLGWRLSGEPGDWQNGRDAVERYWVALGHDREALILQNASGLSPDSRATPRALVDILARTAETGTRAAALVRSMPTGGDGTLRARRLPRDGRVRAKTGSMHGVSALSGVVASRDGRRHLGFSIVLNGPITADRGRHLQDQVVRALVRHVDG